MFRSQSQYLASSNFQSSSKNQADLVVNQSDKTRAEICFILHAVKKNFFLRSCNENGLLYQKMFPDSETVKSYKMDKTKLGYVVNFGFAP